MARNARLGCGKTSGGRASALSALAPLAGAVGPGTPRDPRECGDSEARNRKQWFFESFLYPSIAASDVPQIRLTELYSAYKIEVVRDTMVRAPPLATYHASPAAHDIDMERNERRLSSRSG
ncbi:hypothetical protein HYPSUDRAFT_54996 [Hypholoma sublateritium FD-334 SS-4]|uniref:Uncharacterized protein n=1 Tax=Hypholoma sublateritium (strain FD-334 SS-4) TaxID=945553 RepID=A0A0D2MFF6_HYPSF|nr:hypothetical protein HYPSUDRAFT_54996 [Hypholoma sublateritium FD-334 SS-4]